MSLELIVTCDATRIYHAYATSQHEALRGGTHVIDEDRKVKQMIEGPEDQRRLEVIFV